MELKENKRRLTPQKIATIIIVIISVNLAQHYLFKKPSPEKEIAELIAKYNKTLPTMLHKDIRMDSINSYPNKTVQYNLTLINFEKENIDLEVFGSTLKENLLKEVKNNPGFAAFRENNMTISYKYNDNNRNTLFKIAITPDMYK